MINDKNKDTQDTAGGGESTTENNNVSQTTSEQRSGKGGSTGASARQAKESGPAEFSGQGGEQEGVDIAAIKDTAQGLIDKAKDTAGQAYEMATEKAASKLDEQKAVVTSGLASVAGSIKQVGESLRETDEQTGLTEITAKYGDRLAGQIEQISNYFDKNDLRGIVRDVEDFARKNPAVFIGGAFALGILAARFLKSSTPAAVSEGPAGTRETGKSGNAQIGQGGADNIVSFDSGSSNKNASSARGSIKDPI